MLDAELDDLFNTNKKSGKFFSYAEDGWYIIRDRIWHFDDYLYKQKMSASTIRTYGANVHDFYDWIQTQYDTPPRNLYREHVLKYRDYLKASGVNPRTINHKLSALKKYNEYLKANKHQRHEVFKRGDFLKLRRKKPKAFAVSEKSISNFLEKVRKTDNPRDYALVMLLAHTGIKLQEALALSSSDFDWSECQVVVNTGDRKKERTIPLPEQVMTSLRDYREIRSTTYPKAHLFAYFFASRSSAQLTYSTVNRMFKQHSKTITPKTLRQCYMSGLLNDGFTVAEVVHLTGADAQTVSCSSNARAVLTAGRALVTD